MLSRFALLPLHRRLGTKLCRRFMGSRVCVPISVSVSVKHVIGNAYHIHSTADEITEIIRFYFHHQIRVHLFLPLLCMLHH